MKTLMMIPIMTILAASPAIAAPTTRTVTVDKPNYEGSRTVTRDPEAQSVSRDGQVIRKSDAATASRSYDRARTDSGYVSHRTVTNGAGESVYNRDKSVSRANGQISRSVEASRKQGFRPRRTRR